jgi:hypothetical protein
MIVAKNTICEKPKPNIEILINLNAGYKIKK